MLQSILRILIALIILISTSIIAINVATTHIHSLIIWESIHYYPKPREIPKLKERKFSA